MSTQPNLTFKPSLTLKRRLNAPPAKVYGAWTVPQKIMGWFGPTGARTISAETDPRTGGGFRVVFVTPDGEEHDVSGIYREVVANEKLVFTWVWRSMPERQSQVTILIKPDGAGSLLTLTHEQFFDEAARDRHRDGWTGILDKLERFIT
ncbi:MAG: SRPBCC domain-containing protein [Proteobacteria bacterium]|nr:SRPBCC domain-containing protein [Pseudomonadota bacterium]MBI3496174.1 SRPBCC domain-containing protein [Pseudomonadota bacterium]